MYSDATKLQNGSVLDGYDICIVGAGVAAIAMAKRLAGTSTNVLILCNGTATDAGGNSNPTQTALYQGTVGPFLQKVNPSFCTQSRLNMYGGTSNHFEYYAHPLEEIDMLPRPGYRNACWPISLSEITPYYGDANSFGNYGPFSYDDIPFWERVLNGTAFPEDPDGNFRSLIWHGQVNPKVYQFQTQCGQLVEDAPNINVLFNAHALSIEAALNIHVDSIACSAIDALGNKGPLFFVQARQYVLAMGGVEPVRLMKLSGNIGDNAKGLLGRGFMVHPLIGQAAKATFSTPLDQAIQNFYTRQNVTIPGSTGGETGAGAALQSYNFDAWGVLAPKREVLGSESIGNFHLNLSIQPPGNEIVIGVLWESAPNENSTITLDDQHLDSVFNQPEVHVDWNLMEVDKCTVVRALDLARKFFTSRGATFEVTTDLSGGPEHWTFNPSAGGDGNNLWPNEHHMGALRMSALPEDGIVDSNMRVHTVDNLYIAGSGVYPTSGHQNPSLTIAALALRLAGHLAGC